MNLFISISLGFILLLTFISIAIDFQDQQNLITNNIIQSIKLTSLKSIFSSNWKLILLTVLSLGIPSLLISSPNNFIVTKIQSMMNNIFNNNSNNYGYRRNIFNRRRYRNVDDETIDKVSKFGGNIGGLVNDGNTCFMNSVLQSLASSNTLVDFLSTQSNDSQFVESFKHLINSLNSKHYNKNHDYKTTHLLKTMSKSPSKNFLLGYNQEDAQEFFQSLLSELETGIKKPNQSTNSKDAIYNNELPKNSIHGSDKLGHLGDVYIPANLIDPNLQNSSSKSFKFNLLTPFDGLSAERIGCLQCGEMGGIRYSVISGLSLNLPPDNYTAINLNDLLKEWIKPEIIEGVDCNRCALKHVLQYQLEQLTKAQNSKIDKLVDALTLRIKEIEFELTKPIIDDEVYAKLHTKNMVQKSSKSKQILISRPPPILTIHINRSVFDPVTYRVRKNGAKVVFPVKLDLDPFVAEPKDINTDARLPLSKKVNLEEDVRVTSEDEQDEQVDDEKEKVLEDDVNGQKDEVAEDDVQEQKDEVVQDSVEQEDEVVQNNLKGQDEDVDISEEEGEVEDKLETNGASQNQQIENSIDEDSSDSDSDLEDEKVNTTIPTKIASKIEIKGPFVYQLRSLIVHYGTHNYGHYITFRKYRGVWWRASDENIEIVDEDEVLSTPGVFMLFYELDSLSEELNKDEIEDGDVKVEISIKEDEKEQLEQQDVSTNEQAHVIANL